MVLKIRFSFTDQKLIFYFCLCIRVSLTFLYLQLPYWIDGDIRMSESRAIIKHLARENDPSLLPQTNEELRRAEMMDGVVTDIWDLLVNATYLNTVIKS